MRSWKPFLVAALGCTSGLFADPEPGAKPVRVFLFAGQSNMVGADSHVREVDELPPFAGAMKAPKGALYSYSVGDRESDGWTELAPVDGSFGPEMTFARMVTAELGEPVAILKCAVGGTTLAYDWNPAAPDEGQQLYPRALERVQAGLASLRKKGREPVVEAMFWHQGENDMLSGELRGDYGARLEAFIARWRTDLELPELKWFVGEISDKGIWGMDHRAPMRVVRAQQRAVVAADPLVYWVPTSHLDFEVMGGGQPHYHFGTAGQLQMGEAFAEAWLDSVGLRAEPAFEGYAEDLPFDAREPVRLFLLLGQRELEGEGSYVADLAAVRGSSKLRKPQMKVPLRALLGGGSYRSADWEPLRPIGHLGNFGPELSLGLQLDKRLRGNVALLKITDSAGLMSDWDPTEEDANRPFYATALAFAREAIGDLESHGLQVELSGVVWLHGENETWFHPFRQRYAEGLARLIATLRRDLDAPELDWYLVQQSEQAPWGAERIADLNAKLGALAEADEHVHLVDPGDTPHERVHYGAEGSVRLGELIARELDAD